MALFLVFSVPAFLVFAILYSKQRENKFSLDYITLFKGAIWFIPTLLGLSFVQNIFKVSYKPFENYLYFFYRDHFLYSLLGVVGYFVFFGIDGLHKKRDSFLTPLTFFCGYFFLISLNQFLVHIGEFDFYILFLLPFARIASIIALSLLVERFSDEVSNMKIFYGIIMAVVPLTCGIVSFAYMFNLGILAFFLALAVLALSCAFYYFWKEA